jgi:uncharacterized membrane protein YdbT with pleckstrin-like domain
MAKSYLENLLSDREKIMYSAHQHWFTLARRIFLEIIIILLIFIGAIVVAIFLQTTSTTFPVSILVAISFVILLIPVFTMTGDILDYSHRQFIITNRRVIQLSGVFNKNVVDSSLEKVNDVKMVQTAMGRIFNFGDIEILTASEMGVNLFRHIASPVQFKTAMLNAKAKLEGYDRVAEEEESVPALIEQLDQLRKKGLLTEEEFQQKKTQLLEKLQ